MRRREYVLKSGDRYTPARDIEVTHVGNTGRGGFLRPGYQNLYQAYSIHREPTAYRRIGINANGSINVGQVTPREGFTREDLATVENPVYDPSLIVHPSYQIARKKEDLRPGYESEKVAKVLDAAVGILFGIGTTPKVSA